MNKRLEYIVRVATDLIDQQPSGWSGDINDFVTASAGSLDDTHQEYLTTGDIDDFIEAQRDGEIPTEYDWIRTEDNQGSNFIFIEQAKKD